MRYYWIFNRKKLDNNSSDTSLTLRDLVNRLERKGGYRRKQGKIATVRSTKKCGQTRYFVVSLNTHIEKDIQYFNY